MLDALPWIFTGLAMIGKIFFIYQSRWAARFWLVADAYFAVHTYLREDYAVTFLMLYYFVTSLWAIRRQVTPKGLDNSLVEPIYTTTMLKYYDIADKLPITWAMFRQKCTKR